MKLLTGTAKEVRMPLRHTSLGNGVHLIAESVTNRESYSSDAGWSSSPETNKAY